MGNSMGSLRSSTATQAGPKGASGDKGEPGRPGDRGEKVSQRPKTTLVQQNGQYVQIYIYVRECVCVLSCLHYKVCVYPHNIVV